MMDVLFTSCRSGLVMRRAQSIESIQSICHAEFHSPRSPLLLKVNEDARYGIDWEHM